eukprot:6707775-Alexandrium_andersonii.AAC.1
MGQWAHAPRSYCSFAFLWSPFRRHIRAPCEQWRRTHPSGASGINFEADPGPVQFKLRTPEAIVHVRQFKR